MHSTRLQESDVSNVLLILKNAMDREKSVERERECRMLGNIATKQNRRKMRTSS